uniref:Uncharacterized protein n=1 Tax=Amphimedon queenslandica TaxID=400682 RepID=A0A1X7U493_AMPQE
DINELKTGFNSFTEALADVLQSGNIPHSVEEDILRLQQHFSQTETTEGDEGSSQADQHQNHHQRAQENWMLFCECVSQLQPDVYSPEDYDWLAEARSYAKIEEAATFIAQKKQNHTHSIYYHCYTRKSSRKAT